MNCSNHSGRSRNKSPRAGSVFSFLFVFSVSVVEEVCCTSASASSPNLTSFPRCINGYSEELSASDNDEEGHNIWNVLMALITNFDFRARIQSSLADEEPSRVGLSCHYAMDCLCAELVVLALRVA